MGMLFFTTLKGTLVRPLYYIGRPGLGMGARSGLKQARALLQFTRERLLAGIQVLGV